MTWRCRGVKYLTSLYLHSDSSTSDFTHNLTLEWKCREVRCIWRQVIQVGQEQLSYLHLLLIQSVGGVIQRRCRNGGDWKSRSVASISFSVIALIRAWGVGRKACWNLSGAKVRLCVKSEVDASECKSDAWTDWHTLPYTLDFFLIANRPTSKPADKQTKSTALYRVLVEGFA